MFKALVLGENPLIPSLWNVVFYCFLHSKILEIWFQTSPNIFDPIKTGILQQLCGKNPVTISPKVFPQFLFEINHVQWNIEGRLLLWNLSFLSVSSHQKKNTKENWLLEAEDVLLFVRWFVCIAMAYRSCHRSVHSWVAKEFFHPKVDEYVPKQST